MALYLGKDLISNNAITSDTLPIGAIIDYGGGVAPQGWMICDGAAISRAAFSELFEAIGTIYGSGNGSTTFNIPDFRGKVSVGVNQNDSDFEIGNYDGEKSHTLNIEEMPAHNHSRTTAPQTWAERDAGASKIISPSSGAAKTVTKYSNYTGGSQPHNNMPPYLTTNKIIKVKQQLPDKFSQMPVGATIPFSGIDAPLGWLECDGRAVNRETFSALFHVIGTTYGEGDGVTTFNLPDLRGRIPVGEDVNDEDFEIGAEGGAKGAWKHSHGNTQSGSNVMGYVGSGGNFGGSGSALFGRGAVDIYDSGSTNNTLPVDKANMPPYVTLKYIIKANNNITDEVQDPTVLSRLANIETNNMMRYSTDEIIIGESIDGKPIYRKTFNVGNPPGTNYAFNHNIINLGVIYKLYGTAKDLNNFYTLPYVYLNNYQVSVYANDTSINLIKNSSSIGWSDCIVIIEYTKSID